MASRQRIIGSGAPWKETAPSFNGSSPTRHFHERALSYAVGTDDAENLAGLQIKINPGQNQRVAMPFGQTMYRK